jgi:hypothetical protein
LTRALLDALTLLLATALVVVGAARAARAAGLRDTLELLVAVPVVAATQIVATLVFAGAALHRLDVVVVVAANAVVSGTLLVLVRPARERTRRQALRDALTRLAAGCRWHPIVATLVTIAVVALAWRVLLALVLPPYGFDALTYHLPTVTGWIQTHRISTTPLNVCCGYYPQDGEVLVTWPALLGEGVEYIGLVQIAAALLGAAAVAGIARAARLPAHGAAAAAALFVLTPVLLVQANTVYVDVIFTGAGLAALYLVVRAVEATGRRRLFLFAAAGAATGLCTGTKLTGIEFLATLALPLVVGAVVGRRSTRRETGIATALFAIPAFALGITWYLRSWFATGNPFNPMRVRFLGTTVFAGPNNLSGPPPWLRRHFVLLQPLYSWKADLHFLGKNYTFASQETGGLGPVWTYFGAILTIVFAVYAWKRCRPVFWFFIVPTVLLFAIQPDHWYARYTMGIAAAGSIAVAWAMTASWRPGWGQAVLGVATIVLAAGGAWSASHKILPGARFRSLGIRTVLSDAVHGRRTVGSVFDRDYAFVDPLENGAPIGVDNHNVHFFATIAGRRFQNRLVSIPVDSTLRAFVASHDVAYVVTRAGSHYDFQAQDDPGIFESLGGRWMHAYRVLRSSAAR